MTPENSYERFVPPGRASMAEDAPGWGKACADSNSLTTVGHVQKEAGPVCWKCRGTGAPKHKKRKSEGLVVSECAVCHGQGRLPPKRAATTAASSPGMITQGRRRPTGWMSSGPLPYALTRLSSCKWADSVRRANVSTDGFVCETSLAGKCPDWIPRHGEELCNLVGSWRILQRVGSHRWTTDDLVTAYVAACEARSFPVSHSRLSYLDLGTGNASVLQMVTWALLAQARSVDATGLEARMEAVALARRSLSFNVGLSRNVSARIIHGDFRRMHLEEEARFDLVTGTPPYFRVDFAVDQNESLVTEAVINQGGMPTARQSAPARCEFRGGIEAYCEAASRVLKEDGKFIVCENWLNHDRVVVASRHSNLQIVKEVHVRGREGRGTLFCVYTMIGRPQPTTERENPLNPTVLAVRDLDGNWTKDYAESVLETMSIPYPSMTI